jgi:hypothetical protein
MRPKGIPAAIRVHRHRHRPGIIRAAAAAALWTALPPGAAGAATVTSTWNPLATGANWSDVAQWSNSPAVATFPNNGNLADTFNVVINGGGPVLNQTVSVNDFTFSRGNLTSSSSFLSVNVAGAFTLGAAQLNANATVAAAGQLVLTNTVPSSGPRLGGTLTLGGAATLDPNAAGDLRVDAAGGNGATIQIQPGARFTMGRNITLLGPSVPDPGTSSLFGRINNAGVIEVAAGAAVVADWTVNNTGTIRVNGDFRVDRFSNAAAGLLDLQSSAATARFTARGGTVSGNVRLAAGSRLTVTDDSWAHGYLTFSNVAFTNAGTIDLTGGIRIATPTTIPGTVSLATNTAYVKLAAELTLAGPATFDGGATIKADVGMGTQRVTAADLTFGSGNLEFVDLVVAAGGRMTLSGAGDHRLSSTGVTIQGDAEWRAGAITSVTSATNRVQVAAGGRLTVPSGATVSLARTTNVATVGAVDVLSNAGVLEFDHAVLTVGSSWRLTNTGTVRITAGALGAANPLPFNTGGFDLRDGGGLAMRPQPLDAVRAQIISGRHGGAWDGAGIRSSSAQSDATTAVGYALVAQAGPFLGVPVAAGDVIVRHTKSGDADLNGTVNFADLLALARNYNQSSRHWYQGDFNYDGTVNFGDLLTLAKNYNQALPGEPLPDAPAEFAPDLAAAFAQVPEPGGVLTGVAGALLATGRRRQRRRARG